MTQKLEAICLIARKVKEQWAGQLFSKMISYLPDKSKKNSRVKSSKLFRNIITIFTRFLFTVGKQKLVDFVFHNVGLNILKKCDFYKFWSYMAQKSIEETSKTDCGMNNGPIFPPKVSKEV